MPFRGAGWEVDVQHLTGAGVVENRGAGEELLAVAKEVPVRTEVQLFPLEAANEALSALRRGDLHGAAVLQAK